MWILYTTFATCGLLASLFISKIELSKKYVETKTCLVKKAKDEDAKTVVTGEV
jgi:hypothetical protein